MGKLKTIYRGILLFFLVSMFIFPAFALTPVSEGMNTLTGITLRDIITTERVASAHYCEANPILTAPIISSDKYPNPEYFFAREVLKNPVITLDGNLYEDAVTQARDKFYYASTVIITRDDLSPDSIAVAAYAKQIRSPVLLTASDSIPNITAQAIDKFGARKIIIIGGEEAVSGEIQAELENNHQVERIGGSTRYETAAMLAERMDSPDTIVIADGDEPSTDAALVASIYGAPILYVSSEGVPSPTAQFLSNNLLTQRNYRPMKVVLVGVNPEVANEITELMKTDKWGATITVDVVNSRGYPLFIDLFVDRSSRAKWVEADKRVNYGDYKVDVGTTTLKIRWLEPLEYSWMEKTQTIETEPGETISVTMTAE